MNNLVKNSVVVIALIVVGKILAFLRDIVISHYFGVSDATDSYFVAANIMLFWGALITSMMAFFIPIYADMRTQVGKRGADRFVSNLWNVGMLTSCVCAVLGSLLAPWILQIVVPGFSGEKMRMTIEFSRIMTITFPFTTTIMLFSVLQNVNQRFFISQTPAVFQSIVILGSIWFFANSVGIYAQIVALVLATIINAGIQFVCGKHFFQYSMCFSMTSPELKKLAILAIPLFIGLTADEINVFVNGIICSLLPAGSVSYLNYSQRLLQTVNSTLMSGFVIVLYPQFSQFAAHSDWDSIKFLSKRCICVVTLVMIPIAMFILLYHYEIVKLVYKRGRFDEHALKETSCVFACYSISILFIAYRELFNRLFFVFQDAKRPVCTGVLSMILNIVLSIFLSRFWGVSGIALAASCASIFSAGILYWLLYKNYPAAFIRNPFNYQLIYGITSGLLCMLGVFFFVHFYVADAARLISFVLIAIISFASYLGCLLFFKLDEVIWVRDMFREKFLNKIRQR